MQQLFYLLFKYRVFLTFVALEIAAIWLIINQNTYQRAAFLASSNQVVGTIDNLRNDAAYYLKLKVANDTLMNENARLRKLLNGLYVQVQEVSNDSAYRNYNYRAARVINNSLYRSQNYLTLNKGTAEGITEGMGVISHEGVVGQVKACSEHFSTVYSVLHSGLSISAKLKKSGILGTARWDTGDPVMGTFHDIPRYVEVNLNDTIVTSGFNPVFPEGVMIGTVTQVEEGTSESFLDIKFRYATDFRKLSYVYVVQYYRQAERDSLEQATILTE